jgi:hypothetical protein
LDQFRETERKDHVMRPLKKLLAATTLTAAAGSVFVAAAPASDASVSRPAGILSTAPSCVSRAVYSTPAGFDVFMQNHCGHTVYVRVIISGGPDSVCIELLTNQDRTWSSGIIGDYAYLATC